MQKEIHPKFDIKTKATCACGAVYFVGSTLPEINIEICSSCHPFFSGTEKVIDTAGRVERFNKLRTKVSTKKGKK